MAKVISLLPQIARERFAQDPPTDDPPRRPRFRMPGAERSSTRTARPTSLRRGNSPLPLASGGGSGSGGSGRQPTNDFARRIAETAQALGIDPVDLATVISYETAGTFDPTKRGPTTQWGQHRGLIQFGEPQARQYGIDWDNPLDTQLGPDGAVAKYLRDTGVRPGMGLLDIYSAVNAGGVGRYNRSDANNGGAPGTVRDKVNNQMSGHRRNAEGLFAPRRMNTGGSLGKVAGAAAGQALIPIPGVGGVVGGMVGEIGGNLAEKGFKSNNKFARAAAGMAVGGPVGAALSLALGGNSDPTKLLSAADGTASQGAMYKKGGHLRKYNDGGGLVRAKKFQTLQKIADEHGLTFREILRLNPHITDLNSVGEGSEIRIAEAAAPAGPVENVGLAYTPGYDAQVAANSRPAPARSRSRGSSAPAPRRRSSAPAAAPAAQAPARTQTPAPAPATPRPTNTNSYSGRGPLLQRGAPDPLYRHTDPSDGIGDRIEHEIGTLQAARGRPRRPVPEGRVEVGPLVRGGGRNMHQGPNPLGRHIDPQDPVGEEALQRIDTLQRAGGRRRGRRPAPTNSRTGLRDTLSALGDPRTWRAQGRYLKSLLPGGRPAGTFRKGGRLGKDNALNPIGQDAVKVNGPKHEAGGVALPEYNAEVEGGETIDGALGGDYVFSDSVKVPGTDKTFAQVHEEMVKAGAPQEEIDSLAQTQEEVTGREGEPQQHLDGGGVLATKLLTQNLLKKAPAIAAGLDSPANVTGAATPSLAQNPLQKMMGMANNANLGRDGLHYMNIAKGLFSKDKTPPAAQVDTRHLTRMMAPTSREALNSIDASVRGGMLDPRASLAQKALAQSSALQAKAALGAENEQTQASMDQARMGLMSNAQAQNASLKEQYRQDKMGSAAARENMVNAGLTGLRSERMNEERMKQMAQMNDTALMASFANVGPEVAERFLRYISSTDPARASRLRGLITETTP